MSSQQAPADAAAGSPDVLPDYPILCGLSNLGNTCFANSAIQVATSVTPFVTALRYGPGKFYDDKELQKQFRDLTRFSTVRHQVWGATTALLERMQLAETPFVAPSAILQSVAILNDRFAMGAGQQHDSVEWLSTWVDALDETFQVDLNAAPMADALDAAVRDLPPTPVLQRAQAVASTLRSIDAANDAEELRLKRRKSPHVLDSGYAPPRLHRSPVGDVFRGMQVTTVTCGACSTVSRTATEFTALQLAFPTDADRASYAAMKERENQPAGASAGSDGKSDAAHRRRSGGAQGGVLSTVSGAVALAFGGLLSSMRWIWCCVGGGCCRDFGPLTLDEVLWAHYQPVRLTGDERYRCHSDKCQGELRDATKTIRILTFPEVLLVQLKRFEYGAYWTSKIGEHVAFPLDFTTAAGALPAGSAPVTSDGVTPALDLSPFALDPTAATPTTSSNNNAAAPTGAASSSCAATAIRGTVSSYSLAGVVNHHGSFFGGHYTAFCAREEDDPASSPNTEAPTRFWALHNDERTGQAAPERVADSQAYVLAYRKRPVDAVANGAAVPSPQEMAVARSLLQRDMWREYDSRVMGSDVRFVPRAWLVRLASFTEPGPILTRPCYCTDQRRMTQCFVHGGEVSDADFPPVRQAPAEGGYVDRSNRHFHAPCRWAYTPVPGGAYDMWERKFGSDGAAVDAAAMLRMQQAEMRWRGALEKVHIAA